MHGEFSAGHLSADALELRQTGYAERTSAAPREGAPAKVSSRTGPGTPSRYREVTESVEEVRSGQGTVSPLHRKDFNGPTTRTVGEQEQC